MPVALYGYVVALLTRVRVSTALVLPVAVDVTSSTDTVPPEPAVPVAFVVGVGKGLNELGDPASLRAFLAAA